MSTVNFQQLNKLKNKKIGYVFEEYMSTKLFSGYSTAFRQWRASHSHCRHIHGYSLKFKVVFFGELDDKNWVCDFGCFKRNGIKKYLTETFDHTTIVSKDDPEIEFFEILAKRDVINLIVFPNVGCESFAREVYKTINQLLLNDLTTKNRVRVYSVECIENDKNSAIYMER